MPEVDTDAGSFDDLLNDIPTPAEKESLQSLKDGGVPAETPEQARIRELEERLAEAEKKAVAVEASAKKTKEEKDLEHRIALAQNRSVDAAPEAFEDVEDDEDTLTFHIVDSGFTFLGKVWNYGQNVRIKRGGRAWLDTVDRNGNTWLDDISEEAQYARFKRQVVKPGLYSGPEFNDAIAQEDAKRGLAAPVIAMD